MAHTSSAELNVLIIILSGPMHLHLGSISLVGLKHPRCWTNQNTMLLAKALNAGQFGEVHMQPEFNSKPKALLIV